MKNINQMNEVPSYLRNKPTIESSTLQTVRERVAEIRDLKARIAYLEEQLAEENKRYYELTRVILPEMFNEAGVNVLELQAEGNYPAIIAEKTPYFKANIAASWDTDRKAKAFAYLEKNKAGELIRATITALFGPKSQAQQKSTLAFLRKAKVDFSSDRAVPWGTLTAWLKAEVQKGRMPDLETIGGDVGEIVKLKTPKED